MRIFICENLGRILKNKKKLEEELNIKITNKGREISINGKPEEEYIAEKIIESLDLGFQYKTAILIKEEDFIFEILNIKDYTKRNDLERVRARIIGKGGKTKKTLTQLTECDIELRGNKIGIIGPSTSIENAQEALISLIRGTKQSNLYAYLEKHRAEPIFDLGLKEAKKK